MIILLWKLDTFYRIRGLPLRLLASHLQGRQQFTVVKGASSLEKWVCRRRAAFDHKTTFSLKTRNQPMNFAKF